MRFGHLCASALAGRRQITLRFSRTRRLSDLDVHSTMFTWPLPLQAEPAQLRQADPPRRDDAGGERKDPSAGICAHPPSGTSPSVRVQEEPDFPPPGGRGNSAEIPKSGVWPCLPRLRESHAGGNTISAMQIRDKRIASRRPGSISRIGRPRAVLEPLHL